MAMMHNSLLSYYETIFAYKTYHGWSIDEVLDLMPWELEVMGSLMNNYIEYKEMKAKQANSGWS